MRKQSEAKVASIITLIIAGQASRAGVSYYFHAHAAVSGVSSVSCEITEICVNKIACLREHVLSKAVGLSEGYYKMVEMSTNSSNV